MAADPAAKGDTVIRRAEALLLAVFQRADALGDRIFTVPLNPLHQLGALAFLFFWIATVTGIYLFVFFDTSVSGAYASVESLTTTQWWLGGVMRSLHRYASAAMVVTVTVHLLRELALGRFRGARAFSWISGVPLLWLLFASAIGGYVLVWDQLAQYAAVATAEWLDWLPMFGEPLARNFLRPGSLTDRLFSLLVFLHIAIPLFLLGGMFIHIKRLKLTRINPRATLAAAACGTLVVASLIRPATSMPPADLTLEPALVNIDWIYMNVYPLLDAYGPASVWTLLLGVTVVLVALPKLSPTKLAERSIAVVDPDHCNGCSWCFQDCPFEAITMIPHEIRPGMQQARVNTDLCTGCGICAGACPSATPFRQVEELVSGIELPAYPIERLRRETQVHLAGLPAGAGTLIFGCDHGAGVGGLTGNETAALSLPCIALLPPSFVDWVTRQPQVAHVLITGCHPGSCYQRKGSEWTEQRLGGARSPHLRKRAGPSKVMVRWAGPRETATLAATVADIRRGRAAPEPDAAAPTHARSRELPELGV